MYVLSFGVKGLRRQLTEVDRQKEEQQVICSDDLLPHSKRSCNLHRKNLDSFDCVRNF